MLKRKQIDELFEKAMSIEPVANARIIAAIYDGKKLIAIGNNKCKSHSFQMKFQKNEMTSWIHAEIDAIYKAIKKIGIDRLKKCTLYIVRAKKNPSTKEWQYGLAKPCNGCQSAITVFKIKKVYYTKDNGELLQL